MQSLITTLIQTQILQNKGNTARIYRVELPSGENLMITVLTPLDHTITSLFLEGLPVTLLYKVPNNEEQLLDDIIYFANIFRHIGASDLMTPDICVTNRSLCDKETNIVVPYMFEFLEASKDLYCCHIEINKKVFEIQGKTILETFTYTNLLLLLYLKMLKEV